MRKKKATKNYVILGIIYLAIILLVAYLAKWYQTYQEYEKQTPVIQGVLQEISTNEVEHYLMEEPNTMLYLCTASADTCRDFEKDFKYTVKKKGLETTITYLNLSQEENPVSYVDNFVNKYGKPDVGTSYPMLLQFQDGKIYKYATNLTKESAEAFLKARGY